MSMIKPMAFPSPVVHSEQGLSKLEYFAGLAMQGIIATRHPDYEFNDAIVARDAVQQAKALIAELEKHQ